MQTINLYRYEQNGLVAITPNKRNETDMPYKYRLIAAEGMLVKKGDIETCAKDTDNPEGWVEIIDKINEGGSPDEIQYY